MMMIKVQRVRIVKRWKKSQQKRATHRWSGTQSLHDYGYH